MHKYKYTYKPENKIHKHIWYIIKSIFILAIMLWAVLWTYEGLSILMYLKSKPIVPPKIYQPPIPKLNEAETLIEYVTATTSAYTKIETCPNTECITASGTRPQAGVSVACPRDISLGTKIEIAGQEYTCEDRTHSRFDGRYDLYMGDTEQAWLMAKEYGLQEHLIKIYY